MYWSGISRTFLNHGDTKTLRKNKGKALCLCVSVVKGFVRHLSDDYILGQKRTAQQGLNRPNTAQAGRMKRVSLRRGLGRRDALRSKAQQSRLRPCQYFPGSPTCRESPRSPACRVRHVLKRKYEQDFHPPRRKYHNTGRVRVATALRRSATRSGNSPLLINASAPAEMAAC